MGDAGGGDGEDRMEALIARHKHEKKELQGKILSMKKSISKTDKKKKKELAEQTDKMEHELQKRHAEELSAMAVLVQREHPEAPAAAEPDVADAADAVEELSVREPREPRVSKAQRRRDKKAEQQRERERAIAEQEVANLEGPRHLETEAIRRRLKERGRAVHLIPSDGDCLYAALLHQLGPSAGHSVASLRQLTSEELTQHQDEYRPFLTDPTTGDMYSDDGYERYCRLVAETTAWGGMTEVAALSAALGRTIEVVQAEGAPVILGAGRPGDTLLVTYHRHMYGLGEHYNSTRAATADEEDE